MTTTMTSARLHEAVLAYRRALPEKLKGHLQCGIAQERVSGHSNFSIVMWFPERCF